MTRYRRERWTDEYRDRAYRVRERRGPSYFEVVQWRRYFAMLRASGRA